MVVVYMVYKAMNKSGFGVNYNTQFTIKNNTLTSQFANGLRVNMLSSITYNLPIGLALNIHSGYVDDYIETFYNSSDGTPNILSTTPVTLIINPKQQPGMKNKIGSISVYGVTLPGQISPPPPAPVYSPPSPPSSPPPPVYPYQPYAYLAMEQYHGD